MANAITLANQALSEAGTRSSIASFNENSAESNAVTVHFDSTRDEILAMARWNFATSFAQLALVKASPGTPENTVTPSSPFWLPSQPAPPWQYEYQRPADCITIRYIAPAGTVDVPSIPIFSGAVMVGPTLLNGAAVRFATGTSRDANDQRVQVIWTNQAQAIACYTARVEEVDQWEPLFTEAFKHALAGKLVLALEGDKALAKALFDLANEAIIRARTADANEGLTVQESTPDWLAARGSMLEGWEIVRPGLALGPTFSPTGGVTGSGLTTDTGASIEFGT